MPAKTMSKFSGTCRNDSMAPITIIGFNPHMHKLGRHMNTVIKRSSGMMETVFDNDFDFANQVTYILDTPIVLAAGESITSTCAFDNETSAAALRAVDHTRDVLQLRDVLSSEGAGQRRRELDRRDKHLLVMS